MLSASLNKTFPSLLPPGGEPGRGPAAEAPEQGEAAREGQAETEAADRADGGREPRRILPLPDHRLRIQRPQGEHLVSCDR